MPIILATTTITIKGRRPQILQDPEGEGYDEPVPDIEDIATGVRACITSGSGTKTMALRSDIHFAPVALEVDNMYIRCDPCDITRYDHIIDDTTGTEYTVEEIFNSNIEMFNMNHMHGRLRVFRGVASA